MMDIFMLAMGVGFFALAVAYAVACDRLWRGTTMIIDYALALLVTIGLLIYLTYALLRPERFWGAYNHDG
jgi:K+-transporting ATPase KdpF subunit